MMFLGKIERRTMSLNGAINFFLKRAFKTPLIYFYSRKVDHKEEKNYLASCELV